MLCDSTEAGLMQVGHCAVCSCDTQAEVDMVCTQARRLGAVEAVQCSSWAEGGAGALELAHIVQRAAEIQSTIHFPYELQVQRGVAPDLHHNSV